MEKNQALKSVMAVVLGLLAGAVLMLVMGFDPLVAYDSLFKGGLKNITKIGDTIASDEDLERDAIRRIDHECMKRELWLAVDQLPDRLPAAIRLRYEKGLTYKEMGERLGVNMNQARSLEQKAFKKLRIPSRAKRFRAYHEEYLSASQIHHVGVRRFNETWTSEVERDAIR